MDDPRQAPPVPSPYYKVGDTALFILFDITKVSFETIFPVELMRQYEREGIYAYFKFVENPDNRKILQENWQKWYKAVPHQELR